MNFSKQRLTIIYGSQTGTAYDISTWLANRLTPKFASVDCYDGNSYISDKSLLSESVSIFILATSGNGDSPINFRKFWNFVFSDECMSLFKGRKFAVFGLGDSKYEQFNYAARILYGRLRFIGGVPLCQLGCGDDQHTLGVFQEFSPWFSTMCVSLFGEELVSDDLSVHYSRYSLLQESSNTSCGAAPPVYNHCRVVWNRRLTHPAHFQNVFKLTLNVFGRWDYEPGDAIAVYPKICLETAIKFIQQVLNSDPLDRIVLLDNTTKSARTYSLIELFTEVFDITAVPTILFFQVLLEFASAQTGDDMPLIVDKLRELASVSPIGASERMRYFGKEKLSIMEVLLDFHQVEISDLENFLHVIPKISPRYYSIARISRVNSPFNFQTQIDILVSVSESTTLFGRHKIGLASSYLHGLKPGQYIPDRIFPVRGFHTSIDTIQRAKSLLLIGPGTGISPILAICDFFSKTQKFAITGFRNLEMDFLIQQGIPGTDCVVAWSRPSTPADDRHSWTHIDPHGTHITANGGKKTWAQDLISLFKTQVLSILDDPTCVVIICGRSHPMPQQVVTQLENIAGKENISQMRKSARIVFDTWG